MRKFFSYITLFVLMFSFEQAVSEDLNHKRELLPDRMIAGFLDLDAPVSATKVDIKKAHDDGYNVLLVGFGEVTSSEEVNFVNPEETARMAAAKLEQAQKLGMKTLLAVGSASDSFHPDTDANLTSPVGSKMSESQINTLANSIVNFLHKYHFDGIVYSFRISTSPNFILKLSQNIRKIDKNLIIVANPQVYDNHLVSTGNSRDFDDAIQAGIVDYIFIQEYNSYPQYDPNFISESYNKIVNNSKVPLTTKIVIDEPTSAVSAASNSIYHPDGDMSKSLSVSEATKLMLIELEKLKYKPRFAGVLGWSLNTDYAANMHGGKSSDGGVFARSLNSCIYDNECVEVGADIPQGDVIAGFLPLWGVNTLHGSKDSQAKTTPINISLPTSKEYCDEYTDVCKYNVIIMAFLSYSESKGFYLTLQRGDNSNEIYTLDNIKKFVAYMHSKGKKMLISVGESQANIDWTNIDTTKAAELIKDYGFDGVDLNISATEVPENKEQIKTVAAKINRLVSLMKKDDKDFILSFSIGWDNLVAPIIDKNKDRIFINHNYIELLQEIGLNRINYIFVNTYSTNAEYSVYGPLKNKDGQSIEVSIKQDGYAKFLVALAWAMTSQDGYDANQPKYSVDAPVVLLNKKIILTIPATKGVLGSNSELFLSSKDIKNIVSEMVSNKFSVGGFGVWSIDYDGTKIQKGVLGTDYQHKPWLDINTLVNVELPEESSNIVATSVKHQKRVEPKSKSMDGEIVDYPNGIGSYDENSIVRLNHKEYKCKSKLDLKSCNDDAFVPGGLHGTLVWVQVNEKVKQSSDNKVLPVGADYNYPDNIKEYHGGTVVAFDGRLYKCKALGTKSNPCQSDKYAPDGGASQEAWTAVD
ncbi:glycosyl hydrolases 18 family protein [Francisella philomiragia]|uniref:glycosyl hydrolase family 18 protein n=1 Tax=Francisella philomiragia TaxID=28110 RepID=UPI0005A57FF4|nr:glycosyl hydrolase family 18 protein [Francisella philomiragia]AJI54795.1 glycosyl hydrolases 18 family protein [Francisella philomiragia]MBK2253067.1 chitinase [Francisella philomiragia]